MQEICLLYLSFFHASYIISGFLLLLLVTDMDSGCMGEVTYHQGLINCLVTAARCVALRVDVVAEFPQKGEWREALIARSFYNIETLIWTKESHESSWY